MNTQDWLAFTKGDDKAFATLFSVWWEDCYAYAFRVLRDDHHAREVVQELFIRLWTVRASLADVRDPRAYLFTALRNGILNMLASRRDPVLPLDAVNMAVDADPVHQKEARGQILYALEHLPEKTRRVFYLRHFEGLSPREIALETGSAEQTVRNQLATAFKKLQAILLHR
ncbi:RNA polymerase sigma factor [Dinghuibacter silviterrae]|uniref:RNA polymerase sigma-70 factor (ECF subfamily) n=1 Tax=Dinghuibacter silviterrae TaxID=1539049 RepID=A0A4R8DUY2_9BACT|nr:sigma-70 family RNA polymerase sigma factor [Dinghuibacter silviterrae]TDX00981.1 RNA polymerase sigma-70 factor (ECF subfamily) [Dinghuibacter silviterrae]